LCLDRLRISHQVTDSVHGQTGHRNGRLKCRQCVCHGLNVERYLHFLRCVWASLLNNASCHRADIDRVGHLRNLWFRWIEKAHVKLANFEIEVFVEPSKILVHCVCCKRARRTPLGNCFGLIHKTCEALNSGLAKLLMVELSFASL
jgi:hypothetical protein